MVFYPSVLKQEAHEFVTEETYERHQVLVYISEVNILSSYCMNKRQRAFISHICLLTTLFINSIMFTK